MSLVENLFHVVCSVSMDDQGNCDFLTSEIEHFLFEILLRFYLPYDKVLHLAAAHNLHHKVLFIHGSSCFDIGISTDPFIWALFATGYHHP